MANTTDIGQLLRMIVDATHMSPAEYIQKTLGSLRYVYYAYLDKFHTIPADLDDLIDGLLYMDIYAYIQKEHMRNMKRQAEAR